MRSALPPEEAGKLTAVWGTESAPHPCRDTYRLRRVRLESAAHHLAIHFGSLDTTHRANDGTLAALTPSQADSVDSVGGAEECDLTGGRLVAVEPVGG